MTAVLTWSLLFKLVTCAQLFVDLACLDLWPEPELVASPEEDQVIGKRRDAVVPPPCPLYDEE